MPSAGAPAAYAEPSRAPAGVSSVRREKVVGVIYGVDDRRLLDQLPPGVNAHKVHERAEAVFGVFDRRNVEKQRFGAGYLVRTTSLLDVHGEPCVADGSILNGERIGPFCTAFLIDSHTLVTAAHCLELLPADRIVYIRGFATPITQELVPIDGDRVFSGTPSTDNPQSEWLTIDLARNVQGVTPIPRATRPFRRHDRVYALGYPLGLALRYHGGADIGGVDGDNYITNLDAFAGVSGGPVLSSDTHELVGVFTSGINSGVDDEGCWRVETASTDYGESVEHEPTPSGPAAPPAGTVAAPPPSAPIPYAPKGHE